MIIKGYLFSILYGFLCLGLALVAYKLGMPKKYTRKLVHILVGFEWVILYHFMGAGSIHFLAVCLAFTALLAVTYFKELMPMIASEGKNAPGTVYYGVAMSVMALICLFVPKMTLPFGIGVFCTSLGDGLAGIAGQLIRKCNPKIYGEKSLYGTLACFLVSFAVAFAFGELFGLPLRWWHCLLIAVFACELELFIGDGLDNLAVTLGSAILSYAFIYNGRVVDYIVPVILTPLVVAVAYKKNALSLGGIVGALLLDVSVSVAFGNFGFVLLLVFLGGGVLTDRIKSLLKRDSAGKKKHECRDVIQVFSNGFAAMVTAALYLNFENRIFLLAFVATIAEAFADTAASGIGAGAKRVYDVFRFKKCENGLSGGMSLIGTASAAVAAHIVALVAFAFGEISYIEALLVTAVAFIGCIFDSLLGSLVQAKYKCAVCNKTVEAPTHCGVDAKRISGLGIITNNTVNFFSTVFTAALAAILFLFI